MKIPRSILVKCLALTSMGCFLTFTVLVIALHVLRPQEKPLSYTISEYAAGPDSFLVAIVFLLRTLGAVCLVAGFVVGTTRSSRSWAGLVMLALFATCPFLVAIIPASREATPIQLRIHSLSALIGFSSLAIATLVWAQRFRKEVLWRKSALASFVLGLLMLLSLVSFLVSPAGFTGLAERVLEVIMILWLCFMAWQISPIAF